MGDCLKQEIPNIKTLLQGFFFGRASFFLPNANAKAIGLLMVAPSKIIWFIPKLF
jgi:hypothetical protein